MAAQPVSMMARIFSIPKILLLTNSSVSTRMIREVLRRAGLTIDLSGVSTRDDLLSRLRDEDVDLILAPADGLDDFPVADLLEYARNSPSRIPVVLIGTDESEPSAVRALRSGVSDFVRTAQIERLPAILERALREKDARDAHSRIRLELEQVAEMLRENQKLITIGRLTGTIVHEINNPLESISNLLYLMEIERQSPEKREEYLKMAQRELDRVVQISKQTLNFYRETAEPVRVRLDELIEEVLVLYSRRIMEKNINIIRQYDSSDTITVFPGELRQMLSNLIVNAIEASRLEGKIVLRIRNARKWSDQGVRGLRLSVADSGSGIPRQIRERLGEPFFTTKGQRGTGLGLWVTRRILSRYGGSLQLRSSSSGERRGTVFSIFLPTNMRPLAVVTGGGGSGGAPMGTGTGTWAPRLRLMGRGHGPRRVSGD